MLGRVSFWNKALNMRYTTTIGPKIYVNYLWDYRPWSSRYEVLLHERIHQRQMQKFGLLLYFLIYALVPFPLKISYYRKKWESETYELSIYEMYHSRGRDYVLSPKYRYYIIEQFCSASYGFTWYSSGQIIKWLEQTVKAIDDGKLTYKMLANR